MNTISNYYQALGVKRSATNEDLKSAYRQLARRLHPDANLNNVEAASYQFQEITAIYETLSDADRRARYEQKFASAFMENPLRYSLTVTPHRNTVSSAGSPQVVYLLAQVTAGEIPQEARRSHLNITLLFDHSNSMNGERLNKVKVAAHKIIDQLTDKDILSIVAFNDRATVLVPAARVTDKPRLKAQVSLLKAFGSTEMFRGLSAAVSQNRRFCTPSLVNHVVLLTDGNTYGDEERCLELARDAGEEGISISAVGLGDEWNDEFLDEVASISGGTSIFINAPHKIVDFLDNHVRSLSRTFAERVQISIAPDPDIKLEMAFRVSPQPQPLLTSEGHMPLGSLRINDEIQVIFQLRLPEDLELGTRSIARIVVNGDILANEQKSYQLVSEVMVEVEERAFEEDSPEIVINALRGLTIYRMQERAQQALEQGDFSSASARLRNLATALIQIGEDELAEQAETEARQITQTREMTPIGRKELKYQTRQLLLPASVA
ncbi:MAG: DnaJ domain-containing protein [Burkholderiales bacterium]|nr:DnaJ domain-containing protein [Anaerolineae bacterium]